MKNVKATSAIFYIALIFLFKVAGLHTLTHDADEVHIQHCELCDISNAVNSIPLFPTDKLEISKPDFNHVEKELVNLSTIAVFNSRHLSSYLFTRPPPLVS